MPSWCTPQIIPFLHFPKWFLQEKQIISVYELSGIIVYLLFLLHLKPLDVTHVTTPPAIDIFLWLLCKLCCEKFFCKVSSCGNNISMYNLRMWYNKKKDINLQYLKKVSCIFGNVWILCWRSLCCPYYMFSTFELFSGSLVCCYFRTRWRLWILIFCEISHHRNHCYYIKVEYLNLFNSLADIILKNRTMKIKTIQI